LRVRFTDEEQSPFRASVSASNPMGFARLNYILEIQMLISRGLSRVVLVEYSRMVLALPVGTLNILRTPLQL
jgi:hypothetical protein